MSVEPITNTAAEAADQKSAPEIDDKFGRKVFIGNLSFTATEEGVRAFTESAGGSLESLELASRNGRPAGYAFAVWATKDEAEQAVAKLDKQSLDEREINVAIAKAAADKSERRSRKKAAKTGESPEQSTGSVLGGTSGVSGTADAVQATEDQPKKSRNQRKKRPARRLPADDDVEQSAGGEENSVPKPKSKRTRNKKAKAPLSGEVDNPAGAARIDDEGGENSGASSEIKTEKKPRAPRTIATGEPSSTLLFVANLPFSVDDDQLSRIFTELNVSIKSAKVITKPGFQRKGVATAPRSKGFGFVETESQEQQKLALDKLQGYKVDERELVVKVANERQPAPDSPTADGAEI